MTAVVSLAQLFVLATVANAAAGEMTVATILAAQKIEELRAAPVPYVPGLDSVDFLDSRGQALEDADSTGGPAYVRRWQIDQRAADTVAVTVVVSRYRAGDRGVSSAGGLPEDGALPQEIVRVVTLRTRTGP